MSVQVRVLPPPYPNVVQRLRTLRCGRKDVGSTPTVGTRGRASQCGGGHRFESDSERKTRGGSTPSSSAMEGWQNGIASASKVVVVGEYRRGSSNLPPSLC